MKVAKPRKTGRPRGFDRDAAIERAMLLFWRHGYEGVSIAQLTHELGIAPASLYAAFGSKAQLYEEALARYQDRPQASRSKLSDDRPIWEALRDLVHGAIEATTDPDGVRGCMVSSGMVFCAPENRKVAGRPAKIRRQWRRQIKDRLQRAMSAGEIAPGNADVISRYITALLQGLSVQARDGATRKELLAVGDLALNALNDLLRCEKHQA